METATVPAWVAIILALIALVPQVYQIIARRWLRKAETELATAEAKGIETKTLADASETAVRLYDAILDELCEEQGRLKNRIGELEIALAKVSELRDKEVTRLLGQVRELQEKLTVREHEYKTEVRKLREEVARLRLALVQEQKQRRELEARLAAAERTVNHRNGGDV